MSAAPRPAGPQDAVGGVLPRLAIEPTSLEEAAAVMRALAADGLSVAFVGGGTDLGLGAPPSRLDAVLHTRGLRRVREHAPSDQVVAVEAGITLADLQRHLAPHGQRVALDPPLPERATLGGIIAASAFGPRRSRYGAPRDLVIGMTVIRADGVIARGGGKVVKNVAGFDLPRLFCGSLGTLGLVAEVVLRLHPLPEASATVAFAGLSPRQVLALTRAALDARLEPAAVVALEEVCRFRLLLRFEGFGPGVEDQVARALAVGAAPGREGERLDGEAEAYAWSGYDALRTRGDVRAKAAFEPSALAEATEALRPLAASLRGGALALHPTLGIAFVTGTLDEAADPAAGIEAARDAIAAAGGSVVLAEAPAALRALADPWGRTPAALAVMRSLKRELDPDARLAPGRFAGGI